MRFRSTEALFLLWPTVKTPVEVGDDLELIYMADDFKGVALYELAYFSRTIVCRITRTPTLTFTWRIGVS